MSEIIPSQENREISDQELIKALRSKGTEDQEVFRLFQAWQAQEEKKLAKTTEAEIEFNIRKARLNVAAGRIEDAFYQYEGALEQASNERIENERVQVLHDQIMAEMDEFEAKFFNI